MITSGRTAPPPSPPEPERPELEPLDLDRLEAELFDGTEGVDAPVAAARPRPDDRRPARRTIAYQPALDGLRGLALLAIFVYHAGFDWAPGAFLSVSTFFTLSGFLITTLLLREFSGHGRIDRRQFWSRRFRRLLPASLVAVAFIVVTSVRYGEAAQLARLPGDVLAGLANVANWRFIAQGDSYGALFATKSPLQHFWSLAIEEQFYLLYPLLVAGVLVAARGSRRVLALVLAALTAVSLLDALVLLAGGAPVDRLYFGTDVRAAELLIGGLLALWWPRLDVMRRRRARAFTIIGGAVTFVVVLWLWHVADHQNTLWYRGGLVLYAVATAIIILAALQPIGPVRTVLSWRPLVLLGLISYGAYLFHWPVFLWIDDRTGLSGLALFVVRVGVTLALAIACYFLLEAPVRRGAVRGRTALFVVPAAMAVTLLVAVVAGHDQNASAIDLSAARGAPVQRGKNPAYPDTPSLGMYGDSTAYTLGLGMGDWTKAHPDALWSDGGWAGMGCGTLETTRRYRGQIVSYPPDCREWVKTWTKAANGTPNDVAVVLLGPWEVTETQLPGEDRFRVIGDEVLDRAITAKLTEGVDALRASGARVVLLTSPPLDAGRIDGRPPKVRAPESDPSRMARFNQILRDIAASRSGVAVVDLAGYLASLGDKDREVRPDGVHYTWETGRTVSEWLGPQIVDALRTMPR